MKMYRGIENVLRIGALSLGLMVVGCLSPGNIESSESEIKSSQIDYKSLNQQTQMVGPVIGGCYEFKKGGWLKDPNKVLHRLDDDIRLLNEDGSWQDNSRISLISGRSGLAFELLEVRDYSITLGGVTSQKKKIKIRLKESTGGSLNPTIDRIGWIKGFDQSAMYGKYGRDKLEYEEKFFWNRTFSTQVEKSRCSPTKVTSCELKCSNPGSAEFDSCYKKKKEMGCDNQFKSFEESICNANCSKNFASGSKEYLKCMALKMHVISDGIGFGESSGKAKCKRQAEKYACYLPCDGLGKASLLIRDYGAFTNGTGTCRYYKESVCKK